MPQADATDTTNPPVTRQQIEAQIDALIDLLDTLDTDPDLEPSLGWTQASGHYLETPEDLLGNANAGDDREDDDEREPTEDDEASLGWRNEGSQTGYWAGNPLVGIDLEDEHDGCEPEDDSEPDVDSEASLGWTDNPNQESAAWQANHLGTFDLEDGVGPVRKRRPKSKTGGNVLRGCVVLI